MDYASYLEDSKGFADAVGGRIQDAKNLAQHATDAAINMKQSQGMVLESVSGGLLVSAKLANKAFGINKNLGVGLKNIKGMFQSTSSTSTSASETLEGDTGESGEIPNPAFGGNEALPTTQSDIPEGAGGGDVVDNLGSSGGMSSEEASQFTSGEVAEGAAEEGAEGAEVAVESFAPVAEGLEVAGAALDSTGIGAVVGTALEIGAVIGTAVAGLVDMFDSHKEPPTPAIPDTTMFAQPVYQAGFS